MIVTIAQYRLLTGDTTTDASTVSGALVEAQTMIEEALERRLELAERTETLVVQSHGRVFPAALPVVSVSASSATAGTIEFSGFGVRVTSAPSTLLELGDFVDGPSYADSRNVASTVSMTTTGGYAAAELPSVLRRAIARLARGIVTAPTTGGAARPAGATSVSLGDASVSYGASTSVGVSAAVDELVPGLTATLTGYYHPLA